MSLYLYLLHVFLFFSSLSSLGWWFHSGGSFTDGFSLLYLVIPLQYQQARSLSWSWGLGVVRFRQLGSRPAPLTEDRYSAPSQNPEKRPLRYLIVFAMTLCCCGLIWYFEIIAVMALVIFLFLFIHFKLKTKNNKFSVPPRMPAALAFAYTAYAQGNEFFLQNEVLLVSA